MPLYDYQCEDCGALFERLAGINEMVECPFCGFSSKRLISTSGVNTANQDAGWIRSVTEVVDKESAKPEAQEFLKRPTRVNMRNWMKAEGIRHYEKGEPTRPNAPDMSKVHDHVMRQYQERHV